MREQVEAGANRVIRGGNWNWDAQNVRSAYRNANHPGNRNDNLGFRCASSRGRRITPAGTDRLPVCRARLAAKRIWPPVC
ncbi:MAG: SUMF1/EgtB/PvdO family nonheme iron enzyme [Candidatus Binatia bacterium]